LVSWLEISAHPRYGANDGILTEATYPEITNERLDQECCDKLAMGRE
jgi:hypothetical protein